MELALSNGFQEMSFDEALFIDGGGPVQDGFEAAAVTMGLASAYCGAVAVGLAIPTLGMGTAVAGTASASAGLLCAVASAGAWICSKFGW